MLVEMAMLVLRRETPPSLLQLHCAGDTRHTYNLCHQCAFIIGLNLEYNFYWTEYTYFSYFVVVLIIIYDIYKCKYVFLLTNLNTVGTKVRKKIFLVCACDLIL